jgi:hypothetical protein
MCVLAFAVMGCSETTGTGGSAGDGGNGGGGDGGMPECESVEDCDDRNDCTANACANGMCEFTSLENGTACNEANDCTVGTCADGACDTTPVQDGTTCGDDKGTCQQGSCQMACTEQGIRDAIASGGGPYTFGCDGPQTVVTEAEIVIDNNVILDGARALTVDGNNDHLVFSVVEGVTAELIGLTMTGGRSDSSNEAPALRNQGTLTLNRVTVSGNLCTRDCWCGGIDNAGTMTIADSTVSGNRAGASFGDGICNTGDLTLVNSTVSGNDDGGVANYGTMAVIHSTLSGGFNPIYGSPFFTPSSTPTLTMLNSVVVGECECIQPVVGVVPCAVTSGDHNIESPGDSCGFDQPTDQVNISAEALNLGPLWDNGGPTMTHALGWGSVGIDVIPAAECVDADGAPLTTDQSGAPRPEIGGTLCDVGAFEFSGCGVGGPDPWQPGEERLSVGVFYECGRSETILIDGVTTNYFTFVVDENNPSETLTYQQGSSDDRLEGRISDEITLLDQPFWGGGVIWFAPIDLSAWTTMFVAFKSSDPSFARFDVTLQSGLGENPMGFSLDPRDYGYANDGEWHFLQIPLQDAIDRGWDPSVTRSPFIVAAPGVEPGDVLLIDNLYFTRD